MEHTEVHEDTPQPVFGSFTASVGLALGELLLLIGAPEDLGRSLYSIWICAQATLLSCELRWRDGSRTGMPSLVRAALRVVRAWHEETEDHALLGEAVGCLKEVLETMGVRYVPPPEMG